MSLVVFCISNLFCLFSPFIDEFMNLLGLEGLPGPSKGEGAQSERSRCVHVCECLTAGGVVLAKEGGSILSPSRKWNPQCSLTAVKWTVVYVE